MQEFRNIAILGKTEHCFLLYTNLKKCNGSIIVLHAASDASNVIMPVFVFLFLNISILKCSIFGLLLWQIEQGNQNNQETTRWEDHQAVNLCMY